MKPKHLKIGIISFESFKERTLSIANGKYRPSKDEPKIWFSSIESLAQVLSSKNQMLLELIHTKKPKSIVELAALAGREPSNLSRTLKTMEMYGLIELRQGEGRERIPYVPYTHIKVESRDWMDIYFSLPEDKNCDYQPRYAKLTPSYSIQYMMCNEEIESTSSQSGIITCNVSDNRYGVSTGTRIRMN